MIPSLGALQSFLRSARIPALQCLEPSAPAHRNGGHRERYAKYACPKDFVFILHFSFHPNLSSTRYLICSLFRINFIVKEKGKVEDIL
jgi:hypothetical protein